MAKKIEVYPYTRSREVFYFLPNDGKGGVMLQEGPKGYRQFTMQYLPRFYDKGKFARRELVRAKREEIRTAEVDRLRKEGYIPINEMREISGLSDSTLRNAISGNKLKAVNVFHTWYAKRTDYLKYLEEYKPKPRPERQRYRLEKGYDREERIKELVEDIRKAKDK